jgi:hypothetical protein
MPEDTHAWRTTRQFGNAIRAALAACKALYDDVIIPYNEAHPGTELIRATPGPTSFDHRIDGFTDGDKKSPLPDGLSRAQKRWWLVPVRGKAGDPWRAVLAQMNTMPKVGKVFRDFGFPVYTIKGSWISRTRVFDDGTDVYLTSTQDVLEQHPCDHVVPVKMSEYHAAREAAAAAADSPAVGDLA